MEKTAKTAARGGDRRVPEKQWPHDRVTTAAVLCLNIHAEFIGKEGGRMQAQGGGGDAVPSLSQQQLLYRKRARQYCKLLCSLGCALHRCAQCTSCIGNVGATYALQHSNKEDIAACPNIGVSRAGTIRRDIGSHSHVQWERVAYSESAHFCASTAYAHPPASGQRTLDGRTSNV